ncbi:MAG TPA: hypothetical protein VIM55_07135 [Mucilaginibacter sp.]
MIRFDPVDDKDSLHMALNSDYNLIEDSCATIVRRVRFNMRQRKFHGRFTDVSKADPSLVINEGSYNNDGLKDGPFIARYLNGTMLAKGNFKDNKYDGTWNVFYDTGKPRLIFEVTDGVCAITDAWDEKGNKTVDKGHGTYIIDLSGLSWKGKLVNGRPDGTWQLFQSNDIGGRAFGSEYFKKSKFVDGENSLGKYTDAPHIDLTVNINLPFIAAEKILVAPPCGSGPANHTFIDAHYYAGMSAFYSLLRDHLKEYLNHGYLENKEGTFEIMGDVTPGGNIDNLRKTGGSFSTEIVTYVSRVIQRMPRLEPATLDGKTVTQSFKIKFNIERTIFSFEIRFIR